MKSSSILAIIGTLLLVVSHNGVYARNNVLWALGLDSGEQSARQLKEQNIKQRNRIAATRLRRRQDNAGVQPGDQPEILPSVQPGVQPDVDPFVQPDVDPFVEQRSETFNEVVSVEGQTNVRRKKATNAAHERKNERNFEKKFEQHQEKISSIAKKEKVDGDNKKQKEGDKEVEKRFQERSTYKKFQKAELAKNAEEPTTRDDGMATTKERTHKITIREKVAGLEFPNDNVKKGKRNKKVAAKYTVEEERFDKRLENHIQKKLENSRARAGKETKNKQSVESAAERRQDKYFLKRIANQQAQSASVSVSQPTTRNFNGVANSQKKKKEAYFEKRLANQKATAAAAPVEETTKRNGYGSENAHQRKKLEHFQKRVAKHQAKATATPVENPTKRNHKNSGLAARDRREDKRYIKKVENKERNKETEAAALASAGEQNQKHKRGFNKRKEERLGNRRNGEPRWKREQPVIDAVTLRDGGSGNPVSETIDAENIPLSFGNSGAAAPVVTLYWGIFNNPDACPQDPCRLVDAFDPITEASILHGTGGIPDENGDVILVSSIYRTATNLDTSGPAMVDGLVAVSRGAVTSASGFYNSNAEVVVGLRQVASAEISAMAQMLEMTEYIHAKSDLDDFVQYASFKSNEDGFGQVFDWKTDQVEGGAVIHLTRQNDVLQVFFKTNVAM